MQVRSVVILIYGVYCLGISIRVIARNIGIVGIRRWLGPIIFLIVKD